MKNANLKKSGRWIKGSLSGKRGLQKVQNQPTEYEKYLFKRAEIMFREHQNIIKNGSYEDLQKTLNKQTEIVL
jgi:hypothetical protein